MVVPSGFELCQLHATDYEQILALWQEAGLHIRPEGRDSLPAFAGQVGAGTQHVIGLRSRAEPPAASPAGQEGVQAKQAGRLVAVALLTHDGRKGWINRLAVHPAYRRQGLAQALLAEAERWFTADCGLEVWAALIESGNLASRTLFDGMGYQPYDVVYVSKRTRPDA